jgi:hypothetical protein
VALLNAAPYEMRQHAPEFLAAGGTSAQLAALAPMGLEVQTTSSGGGSCGMGQARPRPVAPASLASLEAAYPALASVFSHTQRLCILLTMQMTWNVAVVRCGWGHVPVTPPIPHACLWVIAVYDPLEPVVALAGTVHTPAAIEMRLRAYVRAHPAGRCLCGGWDTPPIFEPSAHSGTHACVDGCVGPCVSMSGIPVLHGSVQSLVTPRVVVYWWEGVCLPKLCVVL